LVNVKSLEAQVKVVRVHLVHHVLLTWPSEYQVGRQERSESFIDEWDTSYCRKGQERHQLCIVDQDPESEKTHILVDKKDELKDN